MGLSLSNFDGLVASDFPPMDLPSPSYLELAELTSSLNMDLPVPWGVNFGNISPLADVNMQSTCIGDELDFDTLLSDLLPVTFGQPQASVVEPHATALDDHNYDLTIDGAINCLISSGFDYDADFDDSVFQE